MSPLVALPTHALCIYKRQIDAKTTLSQEYSDSRWVVRAKVTAADNHWSEKDEAWTIYHLRVLATFKGAPPSNLDLFTYRDSGGFYLDIGTKADLGGVYLLFLNPIGELVDYPQAAHGATEVNYNCGQSRAWTSVSHADQQRIVRLGRAR